MCCRRSAHVTLSRRFLPAMPWPRLCMLAPSPGWWRRSINVWLRRCSLTLHHSSIIMLVGYCCVCVDLMQSTLYTVQDPLHRSSKSSTVIGFLDVYGFEVLQNNRYKLYLFTLFTFFSHVYQRLINTKMTTVCCIESNYSFLIQ